ncbi:MAG: RNA-binding protein, partial [Nanoarchaeota archaeon]|nr:RNA-binding protein [Nanoarchaeota archaeon]
NLIDVGAIATVAAIQSACFPELKDGKVNHKIKTKKKLPVKELPLTITVGKIGDNFVVDPTEAEEEAFDCRLSVAILPNDKICALQKGGDHPIKVADMKKMLEIAITKSKELRKIILEAEK